MIDRFEMYKKNSNYETKNVLKTKLLPFTDKINLSIAEEALKVKVDEISLQLAILLELCYSEWKGYYFFVCCTNLLLISFFIYGKKK